MYWFREQVTPWPLEDVCSAQILRKPQRVLCFLLDITTGVNVTFSDKGSKPAPCEEQSSTELLQDCSCCHNPVWMQHSPFNTLILPLTQARSYSHCWKGTCAALLHTRAQDNLSMDNIYDALIFLPLAGLFHHMAAAQVGTDIWSVSAQRKFSNLDSQSVQRALLSNLLVKAASPPPHPQSRSLLN